MSTLQLRTLGQMGLFDTSGSKLLLAPGKPFALLVYLAIAPGRRSSRDFLLNLLWNDLEPERGRRALRQALFHLRRLLGDEALPGTEELRLTSSVHIDRDAFLSAIERGQLEAALDLYGGEFLPAFGVPGGVEFEQWADLERDRLREAFLRSSELVVRRALNDAHFREAQRFARRARAAVPTSDAAWRLLLEAAVASRDFVAAAVEANALEHWARSEQIALDGRTKALLAAARQVVPAVHDDDESALVADLTGREREFARITTAYESVRTRGALHLHVSGSAGLGKTRLLRDAVARIRAVGGIVVEASGRACDQEIAFAFAADLASILCALPGAAGVAPAAASTLIALNPALSSYLAGTADNALGDEVLRRRIYALTDLVHTIAHERPIVLVIDDVHWLDACSAQLLDGLCNRLAGASILCVTAGRPECAAPGSMSEELTLAPLTETQIASVVSALGTLPGDAPWSVSLIDGLHASSGGSPLLILETLRLALDQQILLLQDGEWRCADDTRLSALLQAGEALRQRVRKLPERQRWLLGVIATIGASVTSETLGRLDGLEQDVEAQLRSMQQHGLLARTSAGWLPAHDEIARAAREAICDRQVEVNRIAGQLLLNEPGDSPAEMRRGLRHLMAAGDADALRLGFVRYARQARARGDTRRFDAMASDIVATDKANQAQLVSALPLHWRLGLWSARRLQVAAALACLFVFAAAGGLYARGTRASASERVFYVDAADRTSAIPATLSEWDGRSTLLLATSARSALKDAALAFRELTPAVSPDQQSTAWVVESSDSTTLDIWLRTPLGARRLTHEWRDDLAKEWLVDGSALLGLTNRWSSPARGGYDVAIFDTATGAARPVTHSIEHEGRPAQSPDGSRIAFTREPLNGAPQLCVTTFDGLSEPECRQPRGSAIAQLLGWIGPTELLVILNEGERRPLVRYDWQHDQTTTLFGPYVTRGLQSPDRRWVVASVRLAGIEGIRDWIIPLDRPASARRVDHPADGPSQVRWWEGVPDNTQMIDHIAFADTSSRIVPGVDTRLFIRAVTRAGTQLPLYAPVRWSSSDTLVATIDSAGIVHPRSVGAVRITASLAGWRRATKSITIGGEPIRQVFRETWDDGWQRRWMLFGQPQPVVTDGPDGVRSFWNHGDADFTSIATQYAAYSARAGLGVEIRLSTPLVNGAHVRARVSLASGVDTAALRGANQNLAVPTVPREDASCAATFPAGDGAYYHQRLVTSGGINPYITLDPNLAKQLASGAWWTLRLQILPDGRCAVRVNDQLVWVSTQPIPLEEEFRLWIGDSSWNAKLLHGPLEMWTGVRTDPPE